MNSYSGFILALTDEYSACIHIRVLQLLIRQSCYDELDILTQADHLYHQPTDPSSAVSLETSLQIL